MSLARGRTNDATGTTGRGHGRTKLEDDLQRRPDAWAVIGFEENAGSADVDAATLRPPQRVSRSSPTAEYEILTRTGDDLNASTRMENGRVENQAKEIAECDKRA